MRRTYVIADADGRMYSSNYPFGLSLHVNEMHPLLVAKFKEAKKYHVLWIANHMARKLSSSSDGYFYVFEAKEVNGQYECTIVDEHLIDDIIEKDKKTEQEVNQIISDWKRKKGIE